MLIDQMSVVRGDDYYSADSRALIFSAPFNDSVPNLTGATLAANFYSQIGVAATLSAVPTVQNGGTSKQQFTLELTAANTALLTGTSYLVAVIATLAGGHTCTVMRIACTVTAPPG